MAQTCRPIICSGCNNIFTPSKLLQKRCRPTCRPRVHMASEICQSCAQPLQKPTGYGKRQYCGPKCQSKSLKGKDNARRGWDKRRARKRNAYIADVYRAQIFERDGWRCQICKLKVNPRYTGTHPKAPSLDHIIPLAVGGTHQPSNVQLAHFGCNARKSSRAANDQLLLIG